VSVMTALSNVRLAKEKIEYQREREEKGFNVKLGRGGIREIEFIAQALQIAFAGGDPWLRAPHTLISLGRLEERGLISETEHSQLSDAYQFLRALEHRLQMEHGLQTHSVPLDQARRELVARRMNFSGHDLLTNFEAELVEHTRNVRTAFDRVFAQADDGLSAVRITSRKASPRVDTFTDPFEGNARLAASIFLKHLALPDKAKFGDRVIDDAALAADLRDAANRSLNPHRALSFAVRVAGVGQQGATARFNLSNQHDFDAISLLSFVCQETPECVVLQPAFNLVPLLGYFCLMQMTLALAFLLEISSPQEQRLDQLRIGQWNLANVQTPEYFDHLGIRADLVPNYFDVVEKCRLNIIDEV